MKLNLLQWLWVSAAALFVLCLLLDIANVWNMSPTYMLLACSLLVVSDWFVMPSLRKPEKAQRRRD